MPRISQGGTGASTAERALINLGAQASSAALDDINDATPTEGDVLTYTSGHWVADAPSTGGGEAFPIGSVFIAVVSTDPATLLGYGTWSAFAAGRVLVGRDAGDGDFDAAEETGGAKTVSAAGSVAAPTLSGSTAAEAAHTHDYSQVLNHTHTVSVTDPGHAHTQTTSATDGATTRADSSSGGTSYSNVANINSNTTGITASTANPAGGVATGTSAAGSSHSHAATGLSASAPAFTGSATSVVQPYIVVYMWKRTA